jgi:hypothetical protein
MKLTLIKGHPETRVEAKVFWDPAWVILLIISNQCLRKNRPLYMEIEAMANRLPPTAEEIHRGCLTTRILAWEEP